MVTFNRSRRLAVDPGLKPRAEHDKALPGLSTPPLRQHRHPGTERGRAHRRDRRAPSVLALEGLRRAQHRISIRCPRDGAEPDKQALIRRTLLPGLLLAALVLGQGGAAAQGTASPAAGTSPATAIVYVTIANDGETDDILLGGETDAAATVELHESVEENGILRMDARPDGIAISAGAETVFDAGGLHVMLVGLTADLRPGGSYDLVLRFERAGEVTVPIQIRFNAEPDDDEPVSEPVTSGDLTISNAWSRPAPALLGAASAAAGEVAGLDTPVEADGLTVVLTADGTAAGPRALTVIVTDTAGEPVTDATVAISTSSLEMDHGVSTSETEMIEPGRYLADHVSMGMGGDWKAEISIVRPDDEAVVVEFLVTLDGPQHD